MQGAQSLKPYCTICRDSETETTIQKSRFLARCFRVTEEAEAAAALASVRKLEWGAKHHCYAFRIGACGELTRSSDDGEPSGTAGAPILNVLLSRDVTDLLCVVTRYFGGILLGTGGLTRAYGGAAQSAVEAAGILRMSPGAQYRAVFSYPLWAAMEPRLRQVAAVDSVEYAECVTASFWIASDACEASLSELRERSDGRIKPEWMQDCMRAQ